MGNIAATPEEIWAERRSALRNDLRRALARHEGDMSPSQAALALIELGVDYFGHGDVAEEIENQRRAHAAMEELAKRWPNGRA